jgi:hypothetical protein
MVVFHIFILPRSFNIDSRTNRTNWKHRQKFFRTEISALTASGLHQPENDMKVSDAESVQNQAEGIASYVHDS